MRPLHTSWCDIRMYAHVTHDIRIAWRHYDMLECGHMRMYGNTRAGAQYHAPTWTHTCGTRSHGTCVASGLCGANMRSSWTTYAPAHWTQSCVRELTYGHATIPTWHRATIRTCGHTDVAHPTWRHDARICGACELSDAPAHGVTRHMHMIWSGVTCGAYARATTRTHACMRTRIDVDLCTPRHT